MINSCTLDAGADVTADVRCDRAGAAVQSSRDQQGREEAGSAVVHQLPRSAVVDAAPTWALQT